MLDQHFELLHDNIKLTKKQKEDVSKKVDGVTRSLCVEFYDGDYESSNGLIVGSHGKKTETRYPVGDVDLIFKISEEDLARYQAYSSNGPSALLTRVKERLKVTYPSSEIHNWGKVVLLHTSEGTHDVEIIPCFENEEGKFVVPDSEGDDPWPTVDYLYEIKMVSDSQATTGLTCKMIKMVKRWNRKSGKPLKSFQIEFFCVGFLDELYEKNMSWSELIEAFFVWMEEQTSDPDITNEAVSKLNTAKKRAQKARDYEIGQDFSNACLEWRKIFGRPFPLYDKDLDEVSNLMKLFPSETEEFIRNSFPVKIDKDVSLKIVPYISKPGFRDQMFSFVEYIASFGSSKLPKGHSVKFKIVSSLGNKANYYWKVRNFGVEAQKEGKLRGVIEKDSGRHEYKDATAFMGTHYIECYAIIAGTCVATARCFVPIEGDRA